MNMTSRTFGLPLLSVVLVASLFATGCARQQTGEPVAVEEEDVYGPPSFTFEREDFSGESASGFQPIVNPDYPMLPAVVDENTSEDELASMALQATLAEEARGEIAPEDVPARQQDIIAFWSPQHQVLKDIIAASESERAAYLAYQIREIRHQAEWERKQEAMQISWDNELRREKLRVLPLVPPDLQERLLRQLRTADPQRSRWCHVVP